MAEDNKIINIKAEADAIRQRYASDPRNSSYNALIYGPTGSGKTSVLRTCRLPLHLDSFDPGGSKVLRGKALLNGKQYEDEMSKGNIIVDSSFENEDSSRPHAFADWDAAYHKRKQMGYFDHIGTYALDSATTWAQDVMYQVIKKAGRVGSPPQQNDWLPQMNILESAIRDMLSLPCDVILVGHDDSDKDEATGKMFISLMITGKLKRRIPLLFDEVYYAGTKETSKGAEYYLLTKRTGLYDARSRLSNNGQLEMYETPDIKAILRKAGMSAEDKPSLF